MHKLWLGDEYCTQNRIEGACEEVDICFLLEESHIQMTYMIHNQVLLAPYGWYSYNNSGLRGNVPQMLRSCNQWYVCLFFVGACPTMGEQYCYRVFWAFIVICDTWSSIAPAIHPYPCIGCNTAKGRYILSKSALRRAVWATSHQAYAPSRGNQHIGIDEATHKLLWHAVKSARSA